MVRLWRFFWKKRYWIACGLIALLALFMRLYQLDQIPYGLHVDEASMAYDGYCIANYGVARNLESFPVYLANYGGGQNALSSYLAAGLFKLFGVSTFALRLPGVLFSLVTVLCGGLVIKEGLGKAAGLAGAALLAVMPYFVMSGRLGLESYLLTGTSTLMLFLLVMAIKKQKWPWFALAGAAMGLSLYSYAVSYVIMPLFLLLCAAYLFYVKKLRLRHLLALGVPLAVLAALLVIFVIINNLGLSSVSIGVFTIPSLPSFRAGEIGFANIVGNIPTVLLNILFEDWLPYNAFSGHFTLYLVSVPFVLVGVWRGFVGLCRDCKHRRYAVSNVVMLFFLCAQFQGLLLGGDGPNINKINAIYFSCAYFLVYGIWSIYQQLGERKVFPVVLSVLYAASCLAFSLYYFNDYPTDVFPQTLFYPRMNAVVEEVEALNTQNLPVYYLDPDASIYYALATEASPYDMHFGEDGLAAQVGDSTFFYTPAEEEELPYDALYVVQETDDEMVLRMMLAQMYMMGNADGYLIFGPV